MKESLAKRNENTENLNSEQHVNNKKDKVPQNLISISIDKTLHRILDIEDCANEFIRAAGHNYEQNARKLKSQIEECQHLFEKETNQDQKLIAARNLRKAIRDIDRHNNSSPILTLEKSLFINLFATFDKYIGDLIIALYHKKIDLYKNIRREIALSEALKYNSMDELRVVMLGQTLWRKQFPEELESADRHLMELIFNFLHMEHLDNAISLSKFALNLPKISTDEIARIFTINYAIALKAIELRDSQEFFQRMKKYMDINTAQNLVLSPKRQNRNSTMRT